MNALSTFRGFLIETGEVSKFAIRFFKEVFFPPYEFREFLIQCYNVGCKSLPLVGITAFIMGLVVTLQSRPTLVQFGAGSWLPAMASVGIVREIGPVVTALMCAGKVGSNIGAELGSMKVTEQIDAMEVSGTNPFKFVAVTRILATTYMVPLLMLYMALVALLGAYVNVHSNEQTSFTSFIENGFHTISYLDIISSVLKSVLFGFTIGVVGCY